MNRYTATKQGLENTVIEKIQEYIAENNLTYTANSADFVRGLVLGLDIGMRTMFYNIVGDNPDDPDESKGDSDKVAEYLKVTNINETPTLPVVDTNV